MTAIPELSSRTIIFSLVASHAGKVCIAVVVNVLPILLPRMGGDLVPGGLSNEEIGRIGGAVFAGLVLGVVITGPLADRLGVRPVATCGSLAMALGLVLVASSQAAPEATLAAVIMGLGAGMMDLVICPLVAMVQPARRASALNRLEANYCLGSIAVILLVSVWLQVGGGWRPAIFALAVLPLILALVFVFNRWPALTQADRRQGLGHLLRSGWLLLSLSIIALSGAVEVGICVWLPTFTQRVAEGSALTGGATLVGFLACMALGRHLAANHSERFSAPQVLGWSAVVTGILVLATLVLPMSWTALTLLVLTGLPIGCLWPTVLAMNVDRFPHGGATLFSLLVAFGNGGGFLMPWCIGLMADGGSFAWGLAGLAMCPALLFVLLGLQRSRGHEAAGNVPIIPESTC